MNEPWIITARCVPSDVSLLGGKAQSVHALEQAGIAVPVWMCLPTLVHEEFLAIRRSEGAASAREFIQRIGEQVSAAWHQAFPGLTTVAVRSSASVEDGAVASYAGQFESMLHVSPARIPEAIAQVFASADSVRAGPYRVMSGCGADLRMAVLIQPMVHAMVSGVLFTADPVTGDAGKSIITAARGLGEGVVKDLADTDMFVVDSASGALLESRIAVKRRMVSVAREGGTCVVEVDSAQAERPALDAAQRTELVKLGQQIHSLYGRPQDIEWAIDPGGRLFILQSRPITAIREEQIFDNANIVENYPGLTLPLTFSVARATYENTFRAASRAFGVPREIMEKSAAVYANLVAVIDGRLYYNILNWYQLYLMVPGFETLVPAWEKALGLPPRAVDQSGSATAYTRWKILARIAFLFLRRGGLMKTFVRQFTSLRDEFRHRKLESCTPKELFEFYGEVFARIAEPFQITVINDLFAQQSLGLVEKLLSRWCGDEATAARNDLLGGLVGMTSFELLGSMERIAEVVRTEVTFRALLAAPEEAAVIWRRLHHEAPYAKLSQLIRAHLSQFGNRTVLELKLETPGVDDDPAPFLQNLRLLVGNGNDAVSLPVDPATRRRDEEFRLRPGGLLGGVRARLIRWLLDYSRTTMRDRETLRLMRAQAYDLVRTIFCELGARLAAAGVIEETRDIFHLTVHEIRDTVESGFSTKFLNRVAARKADYDQYATAEPPARISSGRGRMNCESRVDTPTSASGKGVTLQGHGCSAGTARGRARIVTDPQQAGMVDGAIIVARTTDPGWVFLMARAAGLIVERGNLLSHAAIVGRELGLPIVAGIADATQCIPEGCMVQIDGSSGIVIIDGSD